MLAADDFQATSPCLMTLLKGAYSLCSHGSDAFSYFLMSGFPVLPVVGDKWMGTQGHSEGEGAGNTADFLNLD